MQSPGSSLQPPLRQSYGVQQKSALDTSFEARRASEKDVLRSLPHLLLDQDVLRSLPRLLEPSTPYIHNPPPELSESTPRNLVVCVDGTAKQIGMRVRYIPLRLIRYLS